MASHSGENAGAVECLLALMRQEAQQRNPDERLDVGEVCDSGIVTVAITSSCPFANKPGRRRRLGRPPQRPAPPASDPEAPATPGPEKLRPHRRTGVPFCPHRSLRIATTLGAHPTTCRKPPDALFAIRAGRLASAAFVSNSRPVTPNVRKVSGNRPVRIVSHVQHPSISGVAIAVRRQGVWMTPSLRTLRGDEY